MLVWEGLDSSIGVFMLAIERDVSHRVNYFVRYVAVLQIHAQRVELPRSDGVGVRGKAKCGCIQHKRDGDFLLVVSCFFARRYLVSPPPRKHLIFIFQRPFVV